MSVTALGPALYAIPGGLPWFVSIPVEHSLFPDVEEADQHNADVDDHLPESEHAKLPQQFLVDHGPGNKENRLYVEEDEQHGDQVELDREPVLRVAGGRDAALIGLHFHAAEFAMSDD